MELQKTIKSRLRLLLVLGMCCLAPAAVGCKGKAQGGGPPPGMAVHVVATYAASRPIAEDLSFVGSITANESVEIRGKIDGIIESVGFEEGQAVKQGDVLFEMDQAKLKASLGQAEADLKLAESTLARYQELVETGAVSRQEFDQALSSFEVSKATVELLREQLADAVIRASFDGVVGDRWASVGQYVARGTPLTMLISQDPVKVEFRVPERYLGKLAIGQTVKVEVAAYADTQFRGDVYFVDSRVDIATRTVLMKALVANTEGMLRPGMFAKVGLTATLREKAIVIPETALMLQRDTVSLYVVDKDGSAQLRTVTTGMRLAGAVEILSGLSAGDVVITEGIQKIGPGSKVVVRYEDPASKSGEKSAVSLIPGSLQ